MDVNCDGCQPEGCDGFRLVGEVLRRRLAAGPLPQAPALTDGPGGPSERSRNGQNAVSGLAERLRRRPGATWDRRRPSPSSPLRRRGVFGDVSLACLRNQAHVPGRVVVGRGRATALVRRGGRRSSHAPAGWFEDRCPQPSGRCCRGLRSTVVVAEMAKFPSVSASKLLRVLTSMPLNYEIVRQSGSHRRLVAEGRPPLTFAFHMGLKSPRGSSRRSSCKMRGFRRRTRWSYCEGPAKRGRGNGSRRRLPPRRGVPVGGQR